MSHLLRVDTIAFTVLAYPVSYVELVGTLLYAWSVWLIAKRHVLTWPVGIASVLLYMALFYQIRLYSDAMEQVYYLGASVYGWWYWSRTPMKQHVVMDVAYSPVSSLLKWFVATVALSAAVGVAMTRVHQWAPALFPEPASYPYIDALTTVMSLVAMWLMARKRTESWIYWIVVDLVGIRLYYIKDVRFIAMQYVVLLVLAVRGLANWHRVGVRSHPPREQPA